jgi:multiple sugar transport system substrate-binding protein
MIGSTRRSVLGGSLGLAAAGALVRPYIAKAAATTVETWWNQGYLPEEDVAFRELVADYEKASGDKIDNSLIPNAPLRQKEISAIQSGGVPDVMEVADLLFTPLNAWDDNLIDLGDIVEPNKSHYSLTALSCCHHYNNATKKRAYYMAPMKFSASRGGVSSYPTSAAAFSVRSFVISEPET